jgi:toxin ParE1/3/4
MTLLVTASRFRSDTDLILSYLERVAGRGVASRYSGRFEEVILRLIRFPESGAPRPALGANARVAIVQPYLLIYDFTPEDNTLTLLRVLHGRRNITRELLGH